MYAVAILYSFKKLSSSYKYNAIPEWRHVSNTDCYGQFGGGEIGFNHGWEKPRFLKKKQPTWVFLFFLWKKQFFWFFKKKQDFVLYLGKWKNLILNFFYCIMQYHYFYNYTITCYTYYTIQIWG